MSMSVVLYQSSLHYLQNGIKLLEIAKTKTKNIINHAPMILIYRFLILYILCNIYYLGLHVILYTSFSAKIKKYYKHLITQRFFISYIKEMYQIIALMYICFCSLQLVKTNSKTYHNTAYMHVE